jgi:hypothetical protein
MIGIVEVKETHNIVAARTSINRRWYREESMQEKQAHSNQRLLQVSLGEDRSGHCRRVGWKIKTLGPAWFFGVAVEIYQGSCQAAWRSGHKPVQTGTTSI